MKEITNRIIIYRIVESDDPRENEYIALISPKKRSDLDFGLWADTNYLSTLGVPLVGEWYL